MENKELFRKRAIERLSSPEQLDTIMQITSPAGWVALIGIFVIISAVIVWSILGQIPDKVYARGMILKNLHEIVSDFKGRVTELKVKENDFVEFNEVVANVKQIYLEHDIESKARELKEAEIRWQEEISALEENIKLQKEANEKRKRTLRASIKDLNNQMGTLSRRIENKRASLRKGLITESDLLDTQNELANVRNLQSQKKDMLAQIDSDEFKLERQKMEKENDRDNELSRLKGELADLHLKFKSETEIRSSFSGKVLEIKVSEGDLIEPHTSILILEEQTEKMKLIAYMPIEQGKKVKERMDVRISPSTIKKEEYGFIIGKVESVSKFPATKERMEKILRSDSLVKQLTGKSAPIEISISLTYDDMTVSGFKWTSSQGPPTEIETNTMCEADIIVNRKHPIEYVIPAIKKAVGFI